MRPSEKTKLKVLSALRDTSCWNPHLSNLSRKLKMPISTIFDIINKLREDKRIVINVKILSDLDAFDKKKKKQNIWKPFEWGGKSGKRKNE